MYRETSLALGFGIFLIFVQSGYGLQCWKCNSEYDVTCKDYFNKTKIEENRRHFENAPYGNRQIQPIRNDPHIVTCDDIYNAKYNQKNVCVKKVYIGANGKRAVGRECRLVSETIKAGECPEDVIRESRGLEFCETCDENECNAAGILETSIFLAAAIPTLFLLLFLQN